MIRRIAAITVLVALAGCAGNQLTLPGTQTVNCQWTLSNAGGAPYLSLQCGQPNQGSTKPVSTTPASTTKSVSTP
jgi:hypothetical protein